MIRFTKDIAIKEKYAHSIFVSPNESQWYQVSSEKPPLMKKNVKTRICALPCKNSALMISNTHPHVIARENIIKNVNTLRILHENGRPSTSATDHDRYLFLYSFLQPHLLCLVALEERSESIASHGTATHNFRHPNFLCAIYSDTFDPSMYQLLFSTLRTVADSHLSKNTCVL